MRADLAVSLTGRSPSPGETPLADVTVKMTPPCPKRTRLTNMHPACNGARLRGSGLAGGEVPGQGGAGQFLVHQARQQQRAARPVVRHDVLDLPGGVAGDQDGGAESMAEPSMVTSSARWSSHDGSSR